MTSTPSGSRVIRRYWSVWIVATMSRMWRSRLRSSSSSRMSATPWTTSPAEPSSGSSYIEQRAALRAEAAAAGQSLRLRDGRGVEGPGRRRLPVDDDRRLLLVYPAAADVERANDAVEV